MTPAEKKELAVDFLSEFADPDPIKLATLVADDFQWTVMTRMGGLPPMKGREGFKNPAGALKTWRAGGLGLKFGTVICEGDHCAVQAESNATAANGKKYNNRYHFYI